MTPRNFESLFEFYNDFVKVLYSSIQINNVLPVEVLFELNAAFDHISRRWCFGESEEVVVDKAYSHLKRACLDIFKLQVRQASNYYKELRKIDTSVIDNGKFDRELIKLYHEIKYEAREARRNEGDQRYDTNDKVLAFDYWEPVYQKCIRLEQDFYLHPAIEWAKKRSRILTFKNFAFSILASFIAGYLSKNLLIKAYKIIISLFK